MKGLHNVLEHPQKTVRTPIVLGIKIVRVIMSKVTKDKVTKFFNDFGFFIGYALVVVGAIIYTFADKLANIIYNK